MYSQGEPLSAVPNSASKKSGLLEENHFLSWILVSMCIVDFDYECGYEEGRRPQQMICSKENWHMISSLI